MGNNDKEILKALRARRSRMDESYEDWEPHFRELRQYIRPALGRFELNEDRHDSTINKKLIDTTAQRGNRTLSSGLMAGMTSPSRPWFKLGVPDRALMADPEVKSWAASVEKLMYDVLRGSNAYRMLERCYDNLGLYGTFGGLITGDFENVIHCHSFPMGRYRLAVGARGRVEFLHRDAPMTVSNIVSTFGYENCSPQLQRSFDANRLHDIEIVCHAVERRLDRDPMSPLSVNKPWASYYWEKGRNNLLEHSGFGVNPILGVRWHSLEDEAWSVSSPGMEALGDSIQLQRQHRDKAIAIQKSYNPPLQGASSDAAIMYRNIPGGVTMAQTADLQRGGLRSIYDVNTKIDDLLLDINQTQERIRSAYFADLFLMTSQSDRRQITAREIAERHEEKLLILGPVLEALDQELLQPLIQATFHYMQEAEILPAAPEVVVNHPVKIEYISSLAQAQKAVGVAPIERVIGFAGALAQLDPSVLDNLDGDTALTEFSTQIGAPPDMLNDPEKVKSIREAKALQAQQQQMMENAQPMAQAASLLSEVSDRGAEGLQQGRPL